MLKRYSTDTEEEMKRANNLRKLIGLRKDGLLSMIFGGTEKIVSSGNLLIYMTLSGFSDFTPEELDGICFARDKSGITHSMDFDKVRSEEGEEAYRISTYIG